jgi:hypothetical protein
MLAARRLPAQHGPAGPGCPAGAQVLIRPPQAGPPAARKARHAARETAARAQWRVSAVAVSAATGVAVAAAADTAGRLGHAGAPWADALYWLGQAMVLVPVSARLLSQRVVAAAETVALVVILTVAEYLIRICYSPAAFSYPDELEHWRSTVDVLQTGHLFTANDLLPISPHFPAWRKPRPRWCRSPVSVFHAGLVVVGAAHLLFVAVLSCCCGRSSGTTGSPGLPAVLCQQLAVRIVRLDVRLPDHGPALPRPDRAGRGVAGGGRAYPAARAMADPGGSGHRHHGGHPPRDQLRARGRAGSAGHGRLDHPRAAACSLGRGAGGRGCGRRLLAAAGRPRPGATSNRSAGKCCRACGRC